MSIICHSVIEVTESEVILKTSKGRISINFDDCAKNFSLEKGVESCNCVATRDITSLSYIFFTVPKIKVIFKKHFFYDFVTGKTAVNKFLDLQKAIVHAGYTTYDLS